MKIGYQGVKGCFSWEGINCFLGSFKHIEAFEYDSFDQVFDALKNNDIDYAFVPIENSLGGSLFVNYDHLTDNNFKIIAEYKKNINQCLFRNKKSSINEIKYVYSHPQALAQCKNNILDLNLIPKEYFDTAGSTKISLKNSNSACIAPYNIGIESGLELWKEKFQDNKTNITRFYLLTSKEKLTNTIVGEKTKFTLSFITNDGSGKLSNVLSLFDNQNINLTKLESRPYNSNSSCAFRYVFYCEGHHNSNSSDFKNWALKSIPNVKILGIYPEFDISKLPKNNQFKIGIIGFGRFGQFLAKRMVSYGWEVHATSRTNYKKEAQSIGTIFHLKENFLKIDFDCVLISTSINSLESVLKSIPTIFWNDKLVIDVLSVKKYPHKLLNKYLPESSDILLTHPMFGPDSANESWINKKFIYYPIKIKNNNRFFSFINFWKANNCDMIELSPDWHDQYAANTQFITHLTGRVLNELNLSSTKIDTDGFSSLLNLIKYTTNDSWDLFDGLFKYNISSSESLNKFQWALSNILNKLQEKKIKKSATTEFFELVIKKQEKGNEVINLAIGIPSFSSFPEIKLSLKENHLHYTGVSGLKKLNRKIIVHCSNRENVKFSKYNCVVTPGGKAGLTLALNSISNPGDEWLVPEPFWVTYPTLIESINCKTRYIKTSLSNNWDINLYNLEREFEREYVKGIILCNPHNPLGKIYSNVFLKSIIDLSRKYDKWVICDEVYLSWSNASSILKFSKLDDKIISVGSFSKGWGLMGLRVGWILTPNKISKNIIALQSTWLTCCSNFSQCIALKILGKRWKLDWKKLETQAKKWYKVFDKHGITYTKWEGGIYLFPQLGKIVPNTSEICKDLVNHGLAIMPGKDFGCKSHVRITLQTDSEVMNKATKIFDKYLIDLDKKTNYITL